MSCEKKRKSERRKECLCVRFRAAGRHAELQMTVIEAKEMRGTIGRWVQRKEMCHYMLKQTHLSALEERAPLMAALSMLLPVKERKCAQEAE